MKKWMSFIVFVVSSVTAAGCGDEPVPEQGFVSYAIHVQPILTARCVRCHGGGGSLNGDPDSYSPSGPLKSYNGGKPPTGGFFDCGSEDRGDCSTSGPSCKRGLRHYATPSETAAPGGTKDGFMAAKVWLAMMPPPPSPPLTERESEILARWLAQPDISPCPTP